MVNYEQKYIKYKTKYDRLVKKMQVGGTALPPGAVPASAAPAPAPANCNGTTTPTTDPVTNDASYLFNKGMFVEQQGDKFQPILDNAIVCALTGFRNAKWSGTYSKGGASYEVESGKVYRVASASVGGVTVSQGKNPVFYVSLNQLEGRTNQ
jgi:hypothetical protein